MPSLPLAVQLYTLRNLTAQDFAGTIKQVAALGYRGVELAGYGNLTSPAEIRKVLEDNHLKIAGSHIGLEAMEKDLNKVMDENDLLGNKNLVVPSLAPERRADAAGWKRSAQQLNDIGQKVQPRGFNLAYHNHAFEFELFDGQSGMDILYANAEAKNLKAELDVFWVRYGGQDPAAFITRHAGRVLLVHLKDMEAGPERRFAPVGTGTLDIRGIVAASEQAGAQWLIVEQDNTYQTPPLEALRTSMENLKKMGLA
jgi:sugar phosphate isomerase/epimerase